MKTTIQAALLAASCLLPTSFTWAQNYSYPAPGTQGYCPNGQCQANPNTGNLYFPQQNSGLTPVSAPAPLWNQFTSQVGNMFNAAPVHAAPARNRSLPGHQGQNQYLPNNNFNYPNYNTNYGGSMMIPREMQGIALLPATEQSAALQQRTCPVSGQLLGSEGRPVLVNLNGRNVYVCCEACARAAGHTGNLGNSQFPGTGGLIPLGPANNYQQPAPGYMHQANLMLY